MRNQIRIVAMLALAAGLFTGCGGDQKEFTPPPPPEVTVSRPIVKTIQNYEEFSGTTEAYESIEVRARVEGFLEKVHFAPSTFVEEGDLLFTIDERAYRAKLNQAYGNLAVQQAEENLAKATLARMESAYKDRAVSEVEVLEARAKQEMALANIEAARAQVESAQLDLSYTKIESPIGGRIGRSLVDKGNLVGAGGEKTLLTTIVDDDPMYIYFNLNERQLLQYQKKARQVSAAGGKEETNEPAVNARVYSEDGWPHEGRLDYMENKIDEGTGTIQVRGVFPNKEHILVPGLLAEIRLPMGPPHEAILVPNRALGIDQQGHFIYTVDSENKVVRKNVEVGTESGEVREILSGLNPDETIIVVGLQRARPGIKVTPKPVEAGKPADSAKNDKPADTKKNDKPAETDEPAKTE